MNPQMSLWGEQEQKDTCSKERELHLLLEVPKYLDKLRLGRFFILIAFPRRGKRLFCEIEIITHNTRAC
jgi:hypothetical protein